MAAKKYSPTLLSRSLERQMQKFLVNGKPISQNELAKRASKLLVGDDNNVGQPVINRILSGETENPAYDTLEAIAKVFSLTGEQLRKGGAKGEQLGKGKVGSSQSLVYVTSNELQLLTRFREVGEPVQDLLLKLIRALAASPVT